MCACMMYRNLCSDTNEGADLQYYIVQLQVGELIFIPNVFIENGTCGLLPSRKQHTSRS